MISLIVAHDQNCCIGKNNKLLWHIPNDLTHFKNKTSGKIVIMGRKTYNSIGRELPNRLNIVLTKNPFFKTESSSVLVFDNIERITRNISEEEEVFVIGGEQIYKQFLPIADKLYITYVDHSFEGDTYFPKYNLNEWKIIEENKGSKDDRNPYDYYFREYRRV